MAWCLRGSARDKGDRATSDGNATVVAGATGQKQVLDGGFPIGP
jgi:hypothetical protein